MNYVANHFHELVLECIHTRQQHTQKCDKGLFPHESICKNPTLYCDRFHKTPSWFHANQNHGMDMGHERVLQSILTKGCQVHWYLEHIAMIL